MQQNREEFVRAAVAEYGDMLYRLALFYVRSGADAEDIVQEVLLAYLTRVENGKSIEKSWFVKVTVNKCLNFLRDNKRHRAAIFDESVYAAPSPIGNELYEALETLSPVDREIIWLFYFGGYTSREIAKTVRKSDAAVRKRLERAKLHLRKFLEDE